jgi:hypothetical protein
MQQGPQSNALEVIQSGEAMACLTELHNARLQAPDQAVTLSVDAVAERIDRSADQPSDGGRAEVLSAALADTWLSRMADLQMLEFEAEAETVTATPATSLQWLVVRPDRPERDEEKSASAVAWTAAHLEEWCGGDP